MLCGRLAVVFILLSLSHEAKDKPVEAATPKPAATNRLMQWLSQRSNYAIPPSGLQRVKHKPRPHLNTKQQTPLPLPAPPTTKQALTDNSPQLLSNVITLVRKTTQLTPLYAVAQHIRPTRSFQTRRTTQHGQPPRPAPRPAPPPRHLSLRKTPRAAYQLPRPDL